MYLIMPFCDVLPCVCVLETLYMLWIFTLLKIKTAYNSAWFQTMHFTSLTAHFTMSNKRRVFNWTMMPATQLHAAFRAIT